MTTVLVLAERDSSNGTVKKTTLELLTLARRLGEPQVVWFGDQGSEAASVLGAVSYTHLRAHETDS